MRYAVMAIVSFMCFSFESEGLKRFGKFLERAGQNTRDCARIVAPIVEKEAQNAREYIREVSPKIEQEVQELGRQAERLGRQLGKQAEHLGQQVRDALKSDKKDDENHAEISGISSEPSASDNALSADLLVLSKEVEESLSETLELSTKKQKTTAKQSKPKDETEVVSPVSTPEDESEKSDENQSEE